MKKSPMKRATPILLVAGALAASAALAQHPNPEHHAHHRMGAPSESGSRQPTQPGHDAFGAIQEIIAILEADPETDWSQVDVRALRDHLVDMHELTVNARVIENRIEKGFEAQVTGKGHTLAAIHRMLTAHGHMMEGHRGWKVELDPIENGMKLTVRTDDPAELPHLQALGFYGFMASGHHHGPHHLAIARGEDPHGMGGHGDGEHH